MQTTVSHLRKLFPAIKTKAFHKLIMHTFQVSDISHLLTKPLTITQHQLESLGQNVHDYSRGKPLEYITGSCSFYGMNLIVNNHTLIPRVETELLVENAILEIGQKTCNVLDLCTGSGAIAIATAKHCINAKVLAVDISPEALSVCEQNISKFALHSHIATMQMDILTQTPNSRFDYILSNPPYIETDIIPTLDDGVKHYEPHLALDGGSDGLIFYRKIHEYASSMKNSVFMLEIGFNQKNSVSEIFKEFNPQIIQDYNGHDRIVRFTC